VAAQPLKIVRVAIKLIVFISFEKTLAIAVTLVDTSHSAIADIAQVIFGPRSVLGGVV
jgi:hypothetical protein